MKRIIRIVLLVGIVILTTSSAWVKLTLIRPAVISIPQKIQTIVVVNRALPKDERRNKLEEVLTGEIMRQDEQAIQQTMDGIINTIKNAPRFNIKYANEKYIGETSGTIFPDPLPWEVVNKLCTKYEADAVIAIETFDSDYIITNGHREAERKDENGNVIPYVEFFIEGVGTVNIGFRMYDPDMNSIADQYQFSENMRWDGHGTSPTDAAQALLDKVAAINEVSYTAGRSYALRISPSYYTVTRYFYNKPKKNKHLVEGVRKSEVADWEGAIESWLVAIKKGKKDKDKGRAAFNIAVAYEVLGDTDKALEWSAKAYTEFEDKDANDYHHKLKARIKEERIVNMQLGKE
jgi:tetratricopeptide (TPR) repeat protein